MAKAYVFLEVGDEQRATDEVWSGSKWVPSSAAFVGHKYQDGMPPIRRAVAFSLEEQRLDRPAKVGGVRFAVGLPWSSVIGAAQRQYEFDVTPEKEAARIARAKVVLAEIRSGSAVGASPIRAEDIPEAALEAFKDVKPLAGNEPFDWPDHFIATVRQALAAAFNAMAPAAPVCTHPPGCLSCNWCGFESPRVPTIRRARAANGDVWPAQLTSGVMFYEGERITRREFEWVK